MSRRKRHHSPKKLAQATHKHERNLLPRYLVALYILLITYASLNPLKGWTNKGVALLAFLDTPLPAHFFVFDVTINVLAYIPLGFFCSVAIRNRWRSSLGTAAALMLATAVGLGLSLGMEVLQNYLPTRVSSKVDWATNSLGTLIGALVGSLWGHTLLLGGALHDLRRRSFLRGHYGDFGIMLTLGWVLIQFNPENLLFGAGDLRQLLQLNISIPFEVTTFSRMEGAITAANTLAVGLLSSLLCLGRGLRPTLLLLLAAVCARSLSMTLLLDPDQALNWVTPSNGKGLALGLLVLLPCLWFPAWLRRMLAGFALLVGTVLVNLAPENPYFAQAMLVWRQGHFLNFNGFTHFVSMLWPFLALPWLLMHNDKRDKQ